MEADTKSIIAILAAMLFLVLFYKWVVPWWLKRNPIKYEVRVINRDPFRLRLEEWKSSPELVKQANACLSDPRFRMMLDVLDRENPANIVLGDNTSMETRAIWQARCEGYTICVSNLESMAKYNVPSEPLEATFEPPEKTEEE